MKPSRKLNRGSFMSRVSGGNRAGTGKPAGKGPPSIENDHDLAPAPEKGGSATDSDQ